MGSDRIAEREVINTLKKWKEKDRSWQFEGLAAWTDDAIFEKLRSLGVDTDSARFHEQAVAAGDFDPLEENWCSQVRAEFARTFWLDFPHNAVKELWKRLAPDLICSGWIEERLYQAISAEDDHTPLPEVDGLPADLFAVMELVRFIQGFPPEERSHRFAKINSEGGYYDYVACFSNLVQVRAPAYPDEARRVADMLCECTLPHDPSQAKLAIALAALGRRTESLLRIESALSSNRWQAWTHFDAGRAYRQLGDIDDAIRSWKSAMSLNYSHALRSEARQCIQETLEPAGRKEEADAILLEFPAPPVMDDHLDNSANRSSESKHPGNWPPVVPVRAAPKIGRNDPCPCGSGKKYKKCCMP
jgi:uncharacterized protein YchJ